MLVGSMSVSMTGKSQAFSSSAGSAFSTLIKVSATTVICSS